MRKQQKKLKTNQRKLDDPLAEEKYSPVKGIVKKFSDRVVFCPTYACPMHCDFCFRKNLVNGINGRLSEKETAAAIAYIKKNKNIREVILSGGDPLFLDDKIFSDILKKLRAISHVRLLRIHTRIPVILPTRVTKKLVTTLKNAAPLWIVVHINHPKEITAQFRRAVAKLRTAGIPILSQSVLLRGVNDNPETLKRLFYELTELGIKPYYLHQCDPARGTRRFWVDIKKGKKIMRQLRKTISGLCLPTYVVDSPHRGKMPLY